MSHTDIDTDSQHGMSHSCNGHGHYSHGSSGHHCHVSDGTDRKLLIAALVIIGFFTVVEVVGGWISGSLALIADAGHMATDTAAIALALAAKWLAARPASESYTYGFKRGQILAAFVNGITLFVLIIWLLAESFTRLANPNDILTGAMLAIACLGLVANLVAFWILHQGDHGDMNMRGALLHVVGDILGSGAAIVAALVIMATGWVAIDPILTILVCGLIARSAWGLTRDSAYVLMQGAPQGLSLDAVKTRVITKEMGVKDIRELSVWMLTPAQAYISMDVVLENEENAVAQIAALSEVLQSEFHIAKSTIQIVADSVAQTGGEVPHSSDRTSSVEVYPTQEQHARPTQAAQDAFLTEPVSKVAGSVPN